MRAAVFYGNQDIRIEDVPDPEPGEKQVLLKIIGNGICGTDLHEFFDGPHFLPTEPHVLSGAQLPLVIGHEFGGTVIEMGSGVTQLGVGDVVAVNPIRSCGICIGCRGGSPNTCPKLAVQGIAAGEGGLAQFAVVEESRCFVLPSTVNPEFAPLVEPMAVAWHATRRSRLAVDPAEESAVVFGGGPIGLGVCLVLKAQGFDDVLLVEPSVARQEVARSLGLDVVDPSGLKLEVDRRTRREGVSVAYDCAGVGATLTTAIEALRPGGRVVLVAMGQQPVAFPPPALTWPEASVIGTMCYVDDDFRAVIAAMERDALPTHGWVSWTDLDHLLDDGYEALREARAMKVVVRPNEAS